MTMHRRLDRDPARPEFGRARSFFSQAAWLAARRARRPCLALGAARRLPRPALISLLLGVCCVHAPISRCAPAEERPADIRLANLVRRLGSDVYTERDAAEEQLAGLGAEAQEHLLAAVESPDPEVRLRAKKLLRLIRINELWSPTRVRHQTDQAAASAVLSTIGRQTGNRVLAGDQYGTFHDRIVTMKRLEGTFWEMIDQLCRNSGNRVRPHYDTRHPGLVLAAGRPGKNPIAYSGPIRMRMVRARRAFSEEFDYERLDGELSHAFQFELQAMWEDRFRLIAYRSHPELVKAVTDTGITLAAAQAAASGWNVAGVGTRQLSMNLRMQPPATVAQELETLKLKWGLVAIGDHAHLDIEDFESAEPRYQDDVEVVVQSFERGPGSRCEARLLVVRELVIPEPQELLFEEIEVQLFDDQGRAYHRQGQSNSLTEDGAAIKLVFAGESQDAVPRLLRLTYPRIRTQRDLEIVFRHVPLPCARPE